MTRLPRNERQKGEEAGAFDGGGKFALMIGANPRLAMRHDPTVRIKKFFQNFRVFVINLLDIIGAKMTVFYIHKLKGNIFRVNFFLRIIN